MVPSIAIACALGFAAAESGPRVIEALAGADGQGGVVPYEIALAGRTEPRDVLCGFDDMRGWRLELANGAEATLRATTAEVLWSEKNPVARLAYRGTAGSGRITMRPPAPLAIPDDARVVELWCYGNNWGWVPDPSTPQVTLTLLLARESGAESRVQLTNVRWREWWLIVTRFDRPEGPLRFAGIEVSGAANTEERVLFFESLHLRKDVRRDLAFAPRPKRNLTLFEGQSPGLNTGPGTLPFPTREETILPENLAGNFACGASWETPNEACVFSYKGTDTAIAYRVLLADALPRVLVRCGESAECEALAGAEVLLPGVPGAWRRVSAALDGGVLRLVLRKGEGPDVKYEFRLLQKSLVWDVACLGGKAVELRLGGFGPFATGELIPIPFLTYGASNPPVLLFRPDAAAGLFMTAWPDWYRSNASEPYSEAHLQPDENGRLWARRIGGTRYIPKTDGRRNDLFERIFLTVSPIYEEVLPTIPNPPSPHAREAGTRLWQESWGPESYAQEKARSARLRAHGIRRLTQCNHEIAWRDGGESFTVRLMAAPTRGGDAALKEFVAHQQSLGWLSGLYTNYTDFAPINANWDPDFVQLAPDGQLRPAWPRCYAMKPAKAVEFDAEYAPKIKAKFGSNAAYTDVHTAVAPWHYCDFDHRVPGAGTFAQTLYCYGEVLLHDRAVYGPTWSEGTYQWLYAGLASGNYGLCYSGPDLSVFPLLPVFDLREIHSRECDIGMPWTGGFFRGGDWAHPSRIDASIDRFIMATLAYGHIGWLVEEGHGLRRTCRSYYMMQPVQAAYAQVRPAAIRYADAGGAAQSVSDALRSGAWRDARLLVIYANGLRLWCNGGEALWTVGQARMGGGAAHRIAAGPWLVPPNGYVAKGDDLLVVSAMLGGARFDLAAGNETVYADGRGVFVATPCGLACAGGAAVRRTAPQEFEVIDCGGNEWIGLGSSAAAAPSGFARELAAPFRIASVAAFSDEGADLGRAEVRHGDNGGYFRTKERGVRYVIAVSAEPPPFRIRGLADAPCAEKDVLQFAIVREGGELGPCAAFICRGDAAEGAPVAAREDAPGEFRAPIEAEAGAALWLKVVCGGGEQASTLWKRLTVKPAVVATPIRKEHALEGGTIDFAIERFGERSRATLATPEWLAAPALPIDPVAVLRCAVKDGAAAPASGALFGHAFTVSEQPVVVQDLLAPELSCKWLIAFRGKAEEPGRADTGSTCHRAEQVCGGEKKMCLFMHPPYTGGTGATIAELWPIDVPAEGAALEASIGIADGGDVSDGAVFTVLAAERQGEWVALASAAANRPGWKPFRADLGKFAGKRIFLRLVTDVGPADNSNSDWACFGDARVVRAALQKRLEFK
ncbi:MAG TPA: hypothetical protein DCM87_13570 [Planctomycetes bacterium]|nr:hypothetical protein [Planctomycetota bacterium]